MKYLVTGRQVIPATEHSAQIGYLRRAKDWIKARTADGTLEAVYSFPSGGGFFIINADSHESLMRRLVNMPLRPFSEFEVQPILDFTSAADIVIDAMHKVSTD
jgi:muconolactone delta-isomerase